MYGPYLGVTITESPWGMPDSQRKLTDGVYWVGTPTHGGCMVNMNCEHAQRLSDAAKTNHQWRIWYVFEEDCDYSIVAYEFPELFPNVGKDKAFLKLSAWNPEYLLAVGVEPEPECYARYKEHMEEMARHQEQARLERIKELADAARGWQRIGHLYADGNPEPTLIYKHDVHDCWLEDHVFHTIVHGVEFTYNGNCSGMAIWHPPAGRQGFFHADFGNGGMDVYVTKEAYMRNLEAACRSTNPLNG